MWAVFDWFWRIAFFLILGTLVFQGFFHSQILSLGLNPFYSALIESLAAALTLGPLMMKWIRKSKSPSDTTNDQSSNDAVDAKKVEITKDETLHSFAKPADDYSSEHTVDDKAEEISSGNTEGVIAVRQGDKILTRDGVLDIGDEDLAGKECLKCAEIIKVRAKVCRHCGYEHTEEELAVQQRALADKRRLEEERRKREEELAEQKRREEEERRKKEEELAEQKRREEMMKREGVKYKGHRILMNEKLHYIVTADVLGFEVQAKGVGEFKSLEEAKVYVDSIS